MLQMPHSAPAVATVRRRVRGELARAGVSGPLLDDVEVVISELIGNAVRHARPVPGGSLLVAWQVDGSVVTVRVTDGGSPSGVQPQHVPLLSDSGRGLRIVDRLAGRWGVVDHVGGLRTVWASLA